MKSPFAGVDIRADKEINEQITNTGKT